jgi:hypothetical protein
MKNGAPQTDGRLSEEFVNWDDGHMATLSANNGECVVVAPGFNAVDHPKVVGFEDSKQEGMPERTRLVVTVGAAGAFFADVKAGRFNLPLH